MDTFWRKWPNFRCLEVLGISVDFCHSKLNVTKLHDVGFCQIWPKFDNFEFRQNTRGFSCVLGWWKQWNWGDSDGWQFEDMVPSCFTILNWSFLTKSSKLTILRFSWILIKIEHFEQNSHKWWNCGDGYVNWILDKSWHVHVRIDNSGQKCEI